MKELIVGVCVTLIASVFWALLISFVVLGIFHVPAPFSEIVILPTCITGGLIIGAIVGNVAADRALRRYK